MRLWHKNFLFTTNGVGGVYRNGLVCVYVCSFIHSFIHHTFQVPAHFGQMAVGNDLYLGGYIYYEIPQACLTLGPSLLNSHCFLASSGWCICKQISYRIELNFDGWNHYGTHKTWLIFGHAPCNSGHFLTCNWLVSMHMQTIVPCQWSWRETKKWSVWVFVHLFNCLSHFWGFLHISWQTAHGIDLKLDGYR